MTSPTPHSPLRTWFRTIAFAEAISWAALLISMFFKYVVADDPDAGAQGGVPITGPIHGVIFIVFLVTCFVTWRKFRWSATVLILGLLSAIPPFVTVVFELIADRKGLLAVPENRTTTTP